MKAVLARTPGGPEVLELGDVDELAPGPAELLLAVAAAGVNRADLLQREGRYPPPAGASSIIGLEAAGTVAAIGAGVAGWRIGDRAMALLAGGGYAERVAVPAGHVLRVPDALSLVEAAAVPEAFLTATLTLSRLAPLPPGGRLLVHAAASGVGTAAIQIGRARSAQIAGTVRTASKAGLVRDLGAIPVVVGPDCRFADNVRAALGGGADVILDLVGGSYWPETVASLERGGCISIVGLLGGSKAEVDLGALMRRSARVVGSMLRPLPADDKEALVAEFRDWGLDRLARGELAPTVDRVLPLADASEAHRLLESNETSGKLVLRVNDRLE